MIELMIMDAKPCPPAGFRSRAVVESRAHAHHCFSSKVSHLKLQLDPDLRLFEDFVSILSHVLDAWGYLT